MDTADRLFADGREWDEDAGMEIGLGEDDLIRAIQIWCAAQGEAGNINPTVGQAAAAFCLTPAYLADVFDRRDPFLFTALPADRPEDRLIEQDGL